MKALKCVCFILLVAEKATAQTIDPVCSTVIDFGLCLNSSGCDPNVSKCTCFEGQPFCRCNNRKGEFYIDENCSQRWTLVTFALVASLPGLTLAVLVGVIVYITMLSSSKSKSHHGEVSTASPKGQDLFPGMTFASDMNGRPAPNTRPAQQNHIPMITIPSRANSTSNATRDTSMGGAARPYSSSNSMHPYPDRVTDGRPHEPYSLSGAVRDPSMGGPARPYSNPAGYGQTVNNPYARDAPGQNPYDNHSPAPDHRNDYRQPAPSHSYEDVNHHYSPAPYYGSPDRGNPRGGFPRPHLNLQY